MIALFNQLKSAWSRANDWIKRGEPRRPLPRFTSPKEAADYLMARYTYTGDPLGGAADFFLHPERLQAALEAGPEAVKRLSIDCDDVASFAYAACRHLGQVDLITLHDASGKWGHHVICVGLHGAPRPWAIDTNGYRELPDLRAQTLCDTWTALYAGLGYRYTAAIPTPYPF